MYLSRVAKKLKGPKHVGGSDRHQTSHGQKAVGQKCVPKMGWV